MFSSVLILFLQHICVDHSHSIYAQTQVFKTSRVVQIDIFQAYATNLLNFTQNAIYRQRSRHKCGYGVQKNAKMKISTPNEFGPQLCQNQVDPSTLLLKIFYSLQVLIHILCLFSHTNDRKICYMAFKLVHQITFFSFNGVFSRTLS